ncbi:MAG: DUF350 domain-containing protein [Planctomycetota bacterium]
MDMQFVRATVVNMGINLVYAVVALFVGVLALKLAEKFVLKLDLQEEIKNNNIAGAIFAASLVVFIAIVLAMAMAK